LGLKSQYKIEFKEYFTVSVERFLEIGMIPGDIFVEIHNHKIFREDFEKRDERARAIFDSTFSGVPDDHVYIHIQRALKEDIPEEYRKAIKECLADGYDRMERWETLQLIKLDNGKIAVTIEADPVGTSAFYRLVVVADENNAKIVFKGIGDDYSYDRVDGIYLSRSKKSLGILISNDRGDNLARKVDRKYVLLREVF